MNPFSYVIVIVTYNRLKMLKLCLEHAANQTIPPEAIILVDNGSTDGTVGFLNSFGGAAGKNRVPLRVLHEKENVGGAGGFHDGMRYAMKKTTADWILVIDDDAVLAYDCAEKMNPAGLKAESDAIACSVYYRGSLELSHRKDRFGRAVPEKHYNKPEFICAQTSFCGSMFSRRLIKKIGYPLKEYFIWFDDTEYSLRAGRLTRIIVRTEAKLFHGDPDAPDRRAVVDWRYYYGTRNQLDMLWRHRKYVRFFSFALEVRLIILLRYIRIFFYRNIPAKEAQALSEIKIFKDGRWDGIHRILGKNSTYLSRR